MNKILFSIMDKIQIFDTAAEAELQYYWYKYNNNEMIMQE